MSDPVTAYMRRPSQRIARTLYARGWNRQNTGLRHRIYSAFSDHRNWWDWGHPLMALTGRESYGSWDVPRGWDLWFRHVAHKHRHTWLTTHPSTRPRFGLLTTTDYNTVKATNDGEWRIFDSQNDGFHIVIGYWPPPQSNGRIHPTGLDGRREQALFVSWLLWDGWIKTEWCGLRRWLYYRALHGVVHDRKPFTCQQTPPRGSGGYDHWHCQLRNHHSGPHRYHNMTWTNLPGAHVQHTPEARA